MSMEMEGKEADAVSMEMEGRATDAVSMELKGRCSLACGYTILMLLGKTPQ